MKEVYINNTQITQVGSQESNGKARETLFYDPTKRLIIAKSIYGRKHTTAFTSTSKQADTVYTIAGRDPSTIGRIFLLLENIDRNNMIMKSNSKTKRAVPATSKQDLHEIMGFNSRAAGTKLTKLLEDKGVIVELHIKTKNSTTGKEETNKRFYVNPVYTMAFKGLPLDTYKIFKEAIDELLPEAEIKELSKIMYIDINGEEPTKEPIPVLDKTDKLIDELFSQTDEEKQDIFNQYILHNEPAKTYQLIGSGMVAHEQTDDNDTYFIVNQTANYKQTKPSKADIIGYNAWYLDIDAGRDKDGNYFSMEEVEKRKQQIMSVIERLPEATAIVDTRNGYHVYYACSGLNNLDDAETWQVLQNRLHELVKIADPAAKDASRVLRLPDSKWVKAHTGLEAYDVSIIQAAAVRYTAAEFSAALDKCAESVQAAADKYIEFYPVKKSSSNYNISPAIVTIENQSERIQAIANLSLDTFDIPTEQIIVENINDYLRHINLAEFLQIESPKTFCCILHDDHHPSASIYNNERTGYRYYCASATCAGNGDGHGLDIMDVIQALSNCSYKQALNYLCRMYGIKTKRNA